MLEILEVTIEGTVPLLCNRFPDGDPANETKLVHIGDKGTPMEQAAKKLYIGLKGKPMIPQPNLFRCIMDAGKYFKSGKSKVTTLKSSIIPACLEIEGAEIPLIYKDDWTIDTRAVRIPSTGGRILCHRPSFHDWSLTFTLKLDAQMLSEKMLREIVDAAGTRIGLGDFRPDCKGPFGKFVVTSWKNTTVKTTQKKKSKKAA